MKVYLTIDAREHPLAEALDVLTDEHIDDGNHCAQTIIDLTHALRRLTAEARTLLRSEYPGFRRSGLASALREAGFNARE